MTPRSDPDPLAAWYTTALPVALYEPRPLPATVVVHLYARWSSKKRKPAPTRRTGGRRRQARREETETESVTIQLRNGRKAALARYPGCEIREHSDDGITGETDKRPGYQAMLAEIAAGIGHVVMAKNQSRIERSSKVWDGFRQVCLAAGIVELVTWTRGDVALAPGRALPGKMTSLLNEDYNEQVRLNITDNLATYAADGRPPGGGITGYDPDEKVNDNGDWVPTLTPNELAPVVADAADALLAGMPMLTVVEKYFIEGDVPTPRGGQWRASSVRRLMRSPTLAGIRVHIPKATRDELRATGITDFTLAVAKEHGSVYPGNWPAVIEPTKFLALQALLDSPGAVTLSDGRTATRGVRRGTKAKYLLSNGVAYCGKTPKGKRKVCDHALTGTKRKGNKALYICHSANGGCNGLGITQPETDAEVERQLLEKLASKEYRRRLAKADPYAAKRRKLTARLGEIKAERVLDQADYNAKRLSRQTLLNKAQGLDQEQAQVEATLIALPVFLGAVDPDAIIKGWRWNTPVERRAILQELLVKVVIHPATRWGGVFDPERVELVWRPTH